MKIISVPINKQAMQRLDTDTCFDGDLIEIKLNDHEFKELWNTGVFELLNQKLGVLIDDFEDEVIYLEQLSLAKEVLNQCLVVQPNSKLLADLKNLVEIAEKKSTGIFFFFW